MKMLIAIICIPVILSGVLALIKLVGKKDIPWKSVFFPALVLLGSILFILLWLILMRFGSFSL